MSKVTIKEIPKIAGLLIGAVSNAICGVIMPRPGYLEGLKEIAKENGALLIFDETITGLKTSIGGMQESYNVIPDIALGFKALGGGFPIFTYGVSKYIMDIVSQKLAVHARTFNGNAIGCSAAITVLNELRKDNFAIINHIN